MPSAPYGRFISVAGAEVVTNFSIVVELVESPIIDRFIPLDEEAAAAERCGRFCVVLEDNEDDGLNNGLLQSASAPHAAHSIGMLFVLVFTLGAVIALSAQRP